MKQPQIAILVAFTIYAIIYAMKENIGLPNKHESIKEPSEAREELLALEKEGKYMFHGSPLALEKLSPRQHTSYCRETGKEENHGEPSVCATPFADIAIFRAMVNENNAPIRKHASSFGAREKDGEIKLNFEVTPEVISEIKDKTGYVYVFDKDTFEKFSGMEWRSKEEVVPIQTIKVAFEDLPEYKEVPHETWHQKESKESPISLNIEYGKEQESNRIRNTLKKLPWYKEQGYSNIVVPDKLSEQSTQEEIDKVLSDEYSEEAYENTTKMIHEQWPELAEKLTELKNIPSFELKDTYKVILTKYGSGGSYNYKTGDVILNLGVKGRISTIAHEIVHIGIEHLIQKNNIEHWRKERLVDLIMEKMFPGLKKPQPIKEDADVVDGAFNKHFPNIDAITEEIGKAK